MNFIKKLVNLIKNKKINDKKIDLQVMRGPELQKFFSTIKEEEYPYYLKEIYKYNMNGRTLDLKNPKSLSEKIQWLKLYNNSDLKTKCTDKILVRDYVKEIIGEEYLKPALQICDKFSDIDFTKLPDSFFIDLNHGSKSFYIIKDKEKFLQNEKLIEYVRRRFDYRQSTNYAFYSGFELHYKNIKPRIIVEELLRDGNNDMVEYEIYCFNGEPSIYTRVVYNNLPSKCTVYNKDYSVSNIQFSPTLVYMNSIPEDELKDAVELSKKLAKDFKFVRVDWILSNGKLFFNELTFSPFSGFFHFFDEKEDLELGKLLDLRKDM